MRFLLLYIEPNAIIVYTWGACPLAACSSGEYNTCPLATIGSSAKGNPGRRASIRLLLLYASSQYAMRGRHLLRYRADARIVCSLNNLKHRNNSLITIRIFLITHAFDLDLIDRINPIELLKLTIFFIFAANFIAHREKHFNQFI